MAIWQFYRPEHDDEADPYEFSTPTTSFHDCVAEEIAQRYFQTWDFPSEIRIAVRKAGDQEWRTFDVEVRQEPVFSARLVK